MREIEHRAELYALRVERLKANLLDRSEIETAFSEIVSAIKQAIARSPLSKAEKADVFAQLVSCGEFVGNVTQAQTANTAKSDESPDATNGRGGIDYE